jgi:site-specific DNA recombinase
MPGKRFPRPPKDTASLYVRLSDKPDETSTSLETQEQQLGQLASQHGLTVVNVHKDPGYSGALRDRPGFLAWLDDAKQARCSHLLAHHLDRVSRGSIAGLASFMDVVEGVGADGKPAHAPVRFLSVADRLDSTSASWDMEVGMRGIFAKEERRRISERVSRAKRAMKAQNRFTGGVPPFGWRSVPKPDGPGRVLAPVEEEQEALRAAAKVLIKDGLKAAAKYLNQQTDLKPRRAKAFTRQTLMQTLSSEASSQIFTAVERVQIKEALKPKEERKYHGRNATRLLAGGILRCAGCDRPMYIGTRAVRRKDPNAEPIKHYRCRSALDGYPCDAKVSASARLVEAAVEEAFLEGWGPIEMTEVVSMATEHQQQLALLTEEIDALSETLAKTRGAERRTVVEQLEALEARQAELEARTPPRLSTIRRLGKTYTEHYLQQDLEGRRKLLKRLVGSLHLKPATRQRIRSFDMERIPDRWKLDPVLADAWIPEDGKIEIEPEELARVWGAEEATPT